MSVAVDWAHTAAAESNRRAKAETLGRWLLADACPVDVAAAYDTRDRNAIARAAGLSSMPSEETWALAVTWLREHASTPARADDPGAMPCEAGRPDGSECGATAQRRYVSGWRCVACAPPPPPVPPPGTTAADLRARIVDARVTGLPPRASASRCARCRMVLDDVLAAAGITEHPCCDPDYEDLLDALRARPRPTRPSTEDT